MRGKTNGRCPLSRLDQSTLAGVREKRSTAAAS